MVLDGEMLVLSSIYRLYSNILIGDMMLGEPDGIARAAPDFLEQLILVEVA